MITVSITIPPSVAIHLIMSGTVENTRTTEFVFNRQGWITLYSAPNASWITSIRTTYFVWNTLVILRVFIVCGRIRNAAIIFCYIKFAKGCIRAYTAVMGRAKPAWAACGRRVTRVWICRTCTSTRRTACLGGGNTSIVRRNVQTWRCTPSCTTA